MSIIYLGFYFIFPILAFMIIPKKEKEYCISLGKKKITINSTQFALFIMYIILSLLMGCIGAGADYNEYNEQINNIYYYGFLYSGKEMGFKYISYALMFLFKQANMVRICISFFTNFLFIRTIYKFKSMFSVKLMIVAYISSIYLWGCIELNNYIAFAIIFHGFYNLHKNQTIKYIIHVLIAMLFHSSAIIMFICLFVPKKANNRNITFMIILSVIVITFFNPIVNTFIQIFPFLNKYIFYYDVMLPKISYNNYIAFITPLVYLVLKFYKSNLEDLRMKNLITFGVLLLMISFVYLNSNVIYRLSHYFYIFYIFAIPYARNIIVSNIRVSSVNNEIAIVDVTLLIYCLILYTSFFYMGSTDLLPYIPFWNN